ncbi:hypothetical protein DFH28DRAFT_1080556 [Melampsora americana]|nr:hypothetical protein DFH28DRAFT_1080556 [Melampsora americana]
MNQDSSSSETSSNRSTSPKSLPRTTRKRNDQNSYKAPFGYKRLNENSEFKVSSLNLSKVKNETDQLWIIRLPTGLRIKHLENLKLNLNDFNSKKKSNQSINPQEIILGNLKYEIFIEDLIQEERKSNDEDEDLLKHQDFKKLEPESQEVLKLSTLIPTDQSNQSELYQITKPITKVLFFRRKLEPDPSLKPESIQPKPLMNEKRVQPIDLECRLIPYGAQTDGVSYEYPLRSEEDEKLREMKLSAKRLVDRGLSLGLSQKKRAKLDK